MGHDEKGRLPQSVFTISGMRGLARHTIYENCYQGLIFKCQTPPLLMLVKWTTTCFFAIRARRLQLTNMLYLGPKPNATYVCHIRGLNITNTALALETVMQSQPIFSEFHSPHSGPLSSCALPCSHHIEHSYSQLAYATTS